MYNNHALTLLATAITFSGLLTSAQAACETECTGQQDTAADFTINFDGRCNPTNFANKVTTINDACLMCLYEASTGTAATDAAAALTSLCLDAYAAQTVPFSETTNKGAKFDNEHYAGGGEWNYEVQTASGEDSLEVDAARVDDVYYYQAQRKVISFPTDYIESFNPHTPDNVINGIQDLDGCDLNAAFCCFAQDRQAGDNNGNCAKPYEYNCIDKDPADNTNICYIDHTRSSKSNHMSAGYSIFGDAQTNKENVEGSVHCKQGAYSLLLLVHLDDINLHSCFPCTGHGFAWGEDPLHTDNVYKGNLLFYVSQYDHLTQRGYARNIPGSPMCACAENMAVVTRADCTQIAADEDTSLTWSATDGTLTAAVKINDLNFNACTGTPNNNNLRDRVRELNEGIPTQHGATLSTQKKDAVETILVGSEAGNCIAAIESFLAEKNITKVQ